MRKTPEIDLEGGGASPRPLLFRPRTTRPSSIPHRPIYIGAGLCATPRQTSNRIFPRSNLGTARRQTGRVDGASILRQTCARHRMQADVLHVTGSRHFCKCELTCHTSDSHGVDADIYVHGVCSLLCRYRPVFLTGSCRCNVGFLAACA